MHLRFFLSQCTFLRYYIPIIQELISTGITYDFILKDSKKYNSPFLESNWNKIRPFVEGKIVSSEDECYADHCITIEKNIHDIQSDSIISLTYQSDFISEGFHEYANSDKVKHIVFISRWLAEHYDRVTDKNIYTGSPKYDIDLSKIEHSDKTAVVILPKLRDIIDVKQQANLVLILQELKQLTSSIQELKQLGYTVIGKTRGKDQYYNARLPVDEYYEDESWFPHTTIDLLRRSDIVVNFSSTTIKEIAYTKCKVINFHIKPFDVPFDFLYDNDCVKQLSSHHEIGSAIDELSSVDVDIWDDVIDKYLRAPGGASRRLIEVLLS